MIGGIGVMLIAIVFGARLMYLGWVITNPPRRRS